MMPSARIILYQRREKKSGKFPVKVRIGYLRKTHDYCTEINLTQEEFRQANTVAPKRLYLEIKNDLSKLSLKVDKAIKDIGVFTFQKFKAAFNGNVKEASDIFPFFTEYISILNSDGQIKTATGYTTTMKSLMAFRSSTGFYDIDVQYLKDYQRWMLNKRISKGRVGSSITTVGIYLRNLRSIYNYAISKKIISLDDDYPFGKRKYVIPTGKNVKKALSLTEVGKIYNYSTIAGSPEDKAKDFWLFSYLCNGINFKDIALLKKSCIDDNMLRFVRSKTKRANQANETKISVSISPKMGAIIEKYQNKHSNAYYLYNILEEEDSLQVQQKKIDQFIKTTNKYIKKISDEAVGKKITTKYSRHSAATVLKRSGASTEEISESLGHMNIKTTRNYLDSFDDVVKVELATALADFK